MLMSLKNKLISLGIALSSLSVFGQDIDPDAQGYYQDALSFSQSYFGGSARMQGLAGAQTALGADVSAPLANPAGLGLFRKSTFTFSPVIRLNNSSTNFRSDLNQTTTINNKDNFNIGNMAIVFANTDNGGDWKSEGFAITFNRLNNYHSRISYDGKSNNSFSDYLVDVGNSSSGHFDLDNNNNAFTYSGMAYEVYAIDHDGESFYHYNQLEGIEVEQKEEIVTKGAKNQWDFGYGTNYQNKLFLGASIGVPTIRKERQRSYTETFVDYWEVEEGETINTMNFNETVTTRGTGINAKLGLIYRINDVIRLGASIESPTYYSLREEVEASMKNTYFVDVVDEDDEIVVANNNTLSVEYVPLTFSYNLRTPYKANGGLSLFFGKKGFISTDVELVGYDRMRLSSDDDDINNLTSFSGDNQTIKNIYKATLNYRIGGEFRHESFRLRTGYAYYGDPVRSSVDNISLSRQFFTGGIGLKFPEYFIDLSVVYSTQNEGNTRYAFADGSEPTTVSKFSNTRIMLTLGTTF